MLYNLKLQTYLNFILLILNRFKYYWYIVHCQGQIWSNNIIPLTSTNTGSLKEKCFPPIHYFSLHSVWPCFNWNTANPFNSISMKNLRSIDHKQVQMYWKETWFLLIHCWWLVGYQSHFSSKLFKIIPFTWFMKTGENILI